MTQNASFPPNITTMEDLPKDDNFHNFQCGLELFNDTELPPSLPSSCLALVTEQEFHSNPATNIISSSLTKQETFTGSGRCRTFMPCMQFSTSQKQSAAGQLTQAYFESKHKLESSFHLPDSKLEPTVSIIRLLHPLAPLFDWMGPECYNF
jgi:hypothetical protein